MNNSCKYDNFIASYGLDCILNMDSGLLLPYLYNLMYLKEISYVGNLFLFKIIDGTDIVKTEVKNDNW